MTCNQCTLEFQHLRGAVVSGKYGQYCAPCLRSLTRQANPRSAQYARDRDREAHEKDLIQPWDANGRPSREFIRNYPEEAKLNFSEEELAKYG